MILNIEQLLINRLVNIRIANRTKIQFTKRRMWKLFERVLFWYFYNQSYSPHLRFHRSCFLFSVAALCFRSVWFWGLRYRRLRWYKSRCCYRWPLQGYFYHIFILYISSETDRELLKVLNIYLHWRFAKTLFAITLSKKRKKIHEFWYFTAI